MKTTMLEPLLIKAIDGVAKKLTSAEKSAEKKATRLLAHWNKMEAAEKEQVVGIAVATITTAITAVIALRGRKKSGLAKVVDVVAKKVG